MAGAGLAGALRAAAGRAGGAARGRRGMGSGPPNGFFGEGVQESVPGKLFGESTARGARQPESWETSW